MQAQPKKYIQRVQDFEVSPPQSSKKKLSGRFVRSSVFPVWELRTEAGPSLWRIKLLTLQRFVFSPKKKKAT